MQSQHETTRPDGTYGYVPLVSLIDEADNATRAVDALGRALDPRRVVPDEARRAKAKRARAARKRNRRR